jgi:hypothetical protein
MHRNDCINKPSVHDASACFPFHGLPIRAYALARRTLALVHCLPGLGHQDLECRAVRCGFNLDHLPSLNRHARIDIGST